MSNRFVVRGWTVGYILSESRVVADDTDLRVFRSLTRYLKRGILLTLLFNLLLMASNPPDRTARKI